MTRTKGETKRAAAVVTVKDLEREFGIEGRKLRLILRRLGLKAPEIKQTGFGPRAKYEWDADSKDLAKLRKAIKEALETRGKKATEDEEGEDEE